MAKWKFKTGSHGKKKAPVKVILAAFCVVIPLILAALVIHYGGGKYGIPTWQELYHTLGMESPIPGGTRAADETAVTVLDVGQGDAVLIRQNDAYALIDAGDYEHQDALVSALRQRGVKKLELLIMTHPHADHIGGMLAVAENIPVAQLILPNFTIAPEESALRDWVIDLFAREETQTVTAKIGDIYPLGEGNITVLSAGVTAPENTADDAVNDTSLCLLFTAGSFRFLDTGDAEAFAEQQLAASGQDLRCDLLKAGHHGSSTSNTDELLNAARPKAIAISCGENNDYGHPHEAALHRMTAVGAEIYRTDLDGSITFTPTTEGLVVTDTKNESEALLPAA